MRRFHLIAYRNNCGDEWAWVYRRTGDKWERIAISLYPREFYINEVKTSHVKLPLYIWKEILKRRERGY